MPGAFIRTSRSDLVNIASVAGITSNGDGSAELSLRDGTTVRASRRRAAEVRAALQR